MPGEITDAQPWNIQHMTVTSEENAESRGYHYSYTYKTQAGVEQRGEESYQTDEIPRFQVGQRVTILHGPDGESRLTPQSFGKGSAQVVIGLLILVFFSYRLLS